MQFTTFAVFAVSALVAVAAPTEQSKEQPKGTDPDCTTTSSAIQHAETTPPTGSSSGSAPGQVNASGCKNTQVQSCCNGDQDLAILGGNCFIPLSMFSTISYMLSTCILTLAF